MTKHKHFYTYDIDDSQLYWPHFNAVSNILKLYTTNKFQCLIFSQHHYN